MLAFSKVSHIVFLYFSSVPVFPPIKSTFLFHFLPCALARYRYVANAPGSSAKRSASADSRASSAKSSSTSSSWRRCHGGMLSQLVGAAVEQRAQTQTCRLPGGTSGWRGGGDSLTVMLLQHLRVEQPRHRVVLHVQHQEDVRQGDAAPGLTSDPWAPTLPPRRPQRTLHAFGGHSDKIIGYCGIEGIAGVSVKSSTLYFNQGGGRTEPDTS